MTPVIEFLTTQFKERKQYSTMNSYRSALSATLPPIERHQVGQHPLVCRLLQGMFNQRPPAPRYRTVWSVDTVIKYIQSHLSLTDLSLKNLSIKLVMLLALSNASTASDLASLDIRFQQFSPEGVRFFIPGITKTRRSGPPKEAFFASFRDKSLCPVNTLIVYEEKIHSRSHTSQSQVHQLADGSRNSSTRLASTQKFSKGIRQEQHHHQLQGDKGYQQRTYWTWQDGHENQPLKDSTISPWREATPQRQY